MKFKKFNKYSPINNINSGLILAVAFYVIFYFLFPDDDKFFNFLLDLYELIPLSLMLGIFNDHFTKTK